MILPTSDLRERLLVNDRRRGDDHVPVVKLFNPPRAAAVVTGNVKGQRNQRARCESIRQKIRLASVAYACHCMTFQ